MIFFALRVFGPAILHAKIAFVNKIAESLLFEVHIFKKMTVLKHRIFVFKSKVMRCVFKHARF